MWAGFQEPAVAELVQFWGLGIVVITFVWVISFGLATGIGLVVRPLVTRAKLDAKDLITAFWLGVGLCVAALQLVHFVSPINSWVLTPMAAIGIVGLAAHRRRIFGFLVNARELWRLPLIMWAFLVVWTASRSLGDVSLYDTGLYHAPNVLWNSTYPTVAGLGNLHGRLAFNNSNLLLAALLEAGPFRGRSYHLVNGLFVCAALATVLLRIPRRFGLSEQTESTVFNLTFVPPLVAITASLSISSLSSDVATAAVIFVAASMIFELRATINARTGGTDGTHKDAFQVTAALVLLPLAVCFKLTAAFFSSVAMLFLVGGLAMTAHLGRVRRPLIVGCTVSVLLLTGWLARGVMLSGFPLFPSSILRIRSDWAVPVEQAEAQVAWIGHYGRTFYDATVLHSAPFDATRFQSTQWVSGWIRGLVTDYWGTWFVVFPLLVAVAAMLVVRTAGERRELDPSTAWSIRCQTAAATAAILGWFFLAPAPRFALFPFWVLAAARISRLHLVGTLSSRMAVLAAAGVATLAPLGNIAKTVVDGRGVPAAIATQLAPARGKSWASPSHPDAEIGVYTTDSGLKINVPVNEDQCWYAPLPCTPHPARNLRLRGMSWRDGFRTDGRWLAESWPSRWTNFRDTWNRGRRSTP